jgi:hypothetical protein
MFLRGEEGKSNLSPLCRRKKSPDTERFVAGHPTVFTVEIKLSQIPRSRKMKEKHSETRRKPETKIYTK